MAVEFDLDVAPVEAAAPALDQGLQVADRDTAGPFVVREPDRPTGAREAVGQIVEVGGGIAHGVSAKARIGIHDLRLTAIAEREVPRPGRE